MKNEIILFENQNVKLEVNMKDETVWLSIDQMSKLFNRDKSVISRHIKTAMNEELSNNSVVAKFATTASDGKSYQVDYYNLDVIISVGYRVKSKNGVVFRKWANQILKDYMIKGYSVNQRRLEYLEKTVKLIDIASRVDEEVNASDVKEIIRVINDYSKALDLLDDYDHKTLKKTKGKTSDRIISYDDCMKVIGDLKFNDVYYSLEEKCANLLYMVVKNHVFIDGNKRIAATLFIYFLNFYHILYKEDKQVIDNNTLASLTLLIAQSNPKEKEVLVDLITNFLN